MLPHAVGDLCKPDKEDTGDGGMKQTSFGVHAGCKESQFYGLPFGQAVASMY